MQILTDRNSERERELPCKFYTAGPWDYLDVADIETFLACLNISIFLLRKGMDGKIAALAPRDGPSYAFTFLNDGTESWSDNSV